MKTDLRLRFKLSANEEVNSLEASSNISSIGSEKYFIEFQNNAQSEATLTANKNEESKHHFEIQPKARTRGRKSVETNSIHFVDPW